MPFFDLLSLIHIFQPGEEMRGAKKVLSAAAMTYVASAFMAIMQLLRLLAIAGSRRDD